MESRFGIRSASRIASAAFFLFVAGTTVAPVAQAQSSTSDNRTRVMDTRVYPYSTQCQLIIKWRTGKISGGSGTLIAPNYVLTAGHAVFNEARGGYAESIVVTPGRNGNAAPFGQITVAGPGHFWARDEWRWQALGTEDIGLIKLDIPVGWATGWLGICWFSADPAGIRAYVAGYPLDLADGNQQYVSSGPILPRDPQRGDLAEYEVYYRFTTSPGESGAGIFGIWSNFDPPYLIFAVVSREGLPGTGNPNVGVRITEEIFNELRFRIQRGL
jgi:glutamyl endopeptidase